MSKNLNLSHFISDIMEGKTDDAQRGLIKFSKGEFPGPRIDIKNKGGKITIGGDFEYSKLIQSLFIVNANSDFFKIKGTIITYSDIRSVVKILNNKSPKKNKSLLEFNLEGNFEKSDILELLNNDQVYCLLVNIDLDPKKISSLKTKTRIPKPSMEKSEKQPTFIKMVLEKKDWVKNGVNIVKILAPELSENKKDEKQITIDNNFVITDLILPDNKAQLSSAELRKRVKRIGVLKRVIKLKDEIISNEFKF